MPRYYNPIRPSTNKAATPGQEQKGAPKTPPATPPKDPKKKDDTGGQ